MLLDSERILLYLQLIQLIIMKILPYQNILLNLVDLITFNAKQCLKLDTICYYLRILYGTNSSFLISIYQKLLLLSEFVTLEIVAKNIHNVQNIVYYLRQKIKIVKNDVVLNSCCDSCVIYNNCDNSSSNNDFNNSNNNNDFNNNNNNDFNNGNNNNNFNNNDDFNNDNLILLETETPTIITKIIKINSKLLQTILNIFLLPQSTNKIKNLILITSNQEILDNLPITASDIINSITTIINTLISTNTYATSQSQISISALKDELVIITESIVNDVTKKYCYLIINMLNQYLMTSSFYLLFSINEDVVGLVYEIIVFGNGSYNFNQNVINCYNSIGENCVVGDDLLFYSLNFKYVNIMNVEL